MPTPRAMFRILSVTCLLTRKALRLIITILQISACASCEVLHKYSIYYIILMTSALRIILLLSLLWLSRVCVCT